MAFPDPLDRLVAHHHTRRRRVRRLHAASTWSTGANNSGLRRLLPEEQRELNGFPHVLYGTPRGVGATKRAFLMGNALVVGLVQRIGQALAAVDADNAAGASAPAQARREETCDV